MHQKNKPLARNPYFENRDFLGAGGPQKLEAHWQGTRILKSLIFEGRVGRKSLKL